MLTVASSQVEGLMQEDSNLTEVIQSVLDGDSQGQDQLVAIVTPRIKTYIYRSTLNQDMTEELLQAVYCKMFASLGTLKQYNSFWPWLYRIASNCINTHFRSRSKQSAVRCLQDELLESVVSDNPDAQEKVLTKELARAVTDAISTLKPRDRQVVTLRCFENYSFKQIGEVEQTSEMYSRVLYHRSIEKLRVALKKKGFSNASLLLALTLFGKLTAETEAAIALQAGVVSGVGAAKGAAVTAKLIKAGSIASVYKTRLTLTTVSAIFIVFVILSSLPLRSGVQSVHYITQGVRPVEQVNTDSSSSSSLPPQLLSSPLSLDRKNIEYKSHGAFEVLLYMPDGPDGAILRFEQRLKMESGDKQCCWLQDGSGYYYSNRKQIYIDNSPLRMLVLPTDPPEFIEFIHSQVGFDSRLEYDYKLVSGLMKKTVDDRVDKYAGFECKYSYNDFEYDDLSATWPQVEEVIDRRDIMHKRGWTVYEVTGVIRDKFVSGTGVIPFVYNMHQEHLPWLSIKVGDDLYIDYPSGVAVAETKNGASVYKDGTFLEGLMRPWIGLTCLDGVRRDAAKYRHEFDTEISEGWAVVTIHLNDGGDGLNLVYDIDLVVDVIRTIKFTKGDNLIGELYFHYMQEIAEGGSETLPVPQTDIVSKESKATESLWLAVLAEDSL